MYKCIAARQNKIYREEENKQAREKHKFQRKDKNPMLKSHISKHTHTKIHYTNSRVQR